MDDLVIELPIETDALHELPEDLSIGLTNAAPISPTGVITAVSSTEASATTTILGPPVAEDDINNTSINTPVDGNVLTNDSDPDGDPLTVTEVNGTPIGTTIPTVIPTAGGAVEMNPDGTYTYTPNPTFVGEDTFTYEVTDPAGNVTTATVTIDVVNPAVNADNTPPIANDDHFSTFDDPANPVVSTLFGNDSDPDSDVITVTEAGDVAPGTPFTTSSGATVTVDSEGNFTYTPVAGFVGVDSFEYKITDPSGATDTATATFDVQPDLDLSLIHI